MEHFVILVNGWKLLTMIPKSSILDVTEVLDLPLGYFATFDLKNIILLMIT